MAFGALQFSTDGTYYVGPGMTRETAYVEIVELAKRRARDHGLPVSQGCVTIYFGFEPNDIGGAS